MLIGRIEEERILKTALESDQSEFIVVYGRRRVGKTFLIREAYDYKFTFQHTGIANVGTTEQLLAFRSSLRESGYDDCPVPSTWFEAFDMLASLLKKSEMAKKVVFLDELPWMDTQKSNFIPAFEHFWNGWASAQRNIILVVCGSATSWIIKKVINSHGGLHNRFTRRIAIQPFTLRECELYAKQAGLEMTRYQLLECYMIMGGIPYYWSFLRKEQSLAQNIDRIFFSQNGELATEFRQLYASLFKNPEPYIGVVTALGQKKAGMTREEILTALKLRDNGTLSNILEELSWCGFIRRYNCIGKKRKSAVYQLMDSYTLFYFRYAQNNKNNDEHFWSSSIDSTTHRAWSGYAFERVCLAHLPQIKAALGISGVLTNAYSWRTTNSEHRGAQIDLLIDRNDQVINICEMKYSITEFSIDKDYDSTLRNKKAAFIAETKTRKAVHITMVTTYGLKRNSYSDGIQSQVTMDDLFR